MEHADALLTVEVVYALAEDQVLVCVALPRGSTIQDALERSGILQRFADVGFSTCSVGVFGRIRPRDTLLSDGDRVEIYRPLRVEPKEARRGRVREKSRRRSGN